MSHSSPLVSRCVTLTELNCGGVPRYTTPRADVGGQRSYYWLRKGWRTR